MIMGIKRVFLVSDKHFFRMSKWFKWIKLMYSNWCTDIFVLNINEGAQGGNVHTSIIKSVYGFKLSCWSSPLMRSCLYLTRKRPKFFSSLDSFSRRSSFSTSSWLRNRAARIVMGLGELSWALCQTCFISPTLPSAGRPAEKYTASQNIYMF